MHCLWECYYIKVCHAVQCSKEQITKSANKSLECKQILVYFHHNNDDNNTTTTNNNNKNMPINNTNYINYDYNDDKKIDNYSWKSIIDNLHKICIWIEHKWKFWVCRNVEDVTGKDKNYT